MRAPVLRHRAFARVLVLAVLVGAAVGLTASSALGSGTGSLSFVTDTSWTANGSPAYVINTGCYAGYGAWTTALGYHWIGTAACSAPGAETDTYSKTFNIPGAPTSASIDIAADNEVTLYVNGNQVLAQADAYSNFHTVATVDITPDVHSGSNTIDAVVTNTGTGLSVTGVVARVSVAYNLPDTTPPADSPSASPSPNGNGWNNSDVTVDWNWTDGESGIDSGNCQQQTTSSGEGTVTVGSSCSDNAGNSNSDSRTFKVDKTAPTATPDVPSGWSSSDQTVTWNWSDSGSGIDPSNCTPSTTSSGEGAVLVTATCTDLAGNTGTASATVNVDKTAPVASPDVPSGWHNSDQTVTWNWSDSGSGIDPANCTQSSTSTGEDAAVTVTATCTDNVGNTGTASATVSIDKTAPVAAPSTPPAWSNSDVTVNWNWSDGGAGIDSANCTQSSTSTGEGAITLTASCTDLAGNTGTASQVVHVDKTAPTLNPSVSPNPVGLNNSATASAHATDGGSGIASASCTQPDTSALGTYTVTCTATDKAGNTASATASYDVTGQATKQAILASMKSALGSSSKHDHDALREAVQALAASLDPRLWADANHPSSKRVFEDEQHCVDQLSELLHDRHSAIADATVQGWINALVGEDRALAALAIADATAAGGDSHQLAEANKELAQGDQEAGRGHGNAAIEHYGNAWQQAAQSGKGHGDGGGDGKGHDH